MYPNYNNYNTNPLSSAPYSNQPSSASVSSGGLYPTLPHSTYPAQPQQQANYPNYSSGANPNYGPNQPHYPTNTYGYASNNQPGHSAYQSGGYPSSHPSGYNSSNRQWDEQSFVGRLFDDMDLNRDGRITTSELHDALRRGHPMSEFDPYTVSTLMQRYDRDRDNLIEFHEFRDLFLHLNAQYNEFLDFDSDFSGTMNGYELGNLLRTKGYTFSPDLFNFIVNEISRRSGRNGVTFDTYVRVIARLDFLRAQYQRANMQNSLPLELYIRNNFF